ncbi:Methyltransf-16 multi-domain protein [Pyrenophora tritici-repentis]|uniref:Methyltransf-16 multi-domain protein n=1 Tax=Pyrenophora tritici-repentis TaxID=45151 RepID=A0A2W1EHD6_9PLEO|nr:Methyltransf-16 multi-domain protein [Pyrenophora tritici-repentis]KAF7578926.1 Methyltransf-16 multi-domain protein [Pyrenophora tritici-repentis]KAI0583111.1 Methyltransf-16 multi-domain protein [Pyrenophora tritici-repentis]KAI0589849.1 Methyltransf-16 multi-domain protein [Pyrenophora tritici-repentis]KAI0612997.1 Methyltransf-16 multi-domain protein [Pyrenophora tritici-repentis]
MRYVRFLKTPRILSEKGTSRPHLHCLITITSDLGDSFLPYDIKLAAELLACTNTDQHVVVVWKTVQWSSGMRSLPITLPLPSSYLPSSLLRVKIGLDPKQPHDEYAALLERDAQGVVSAWSPPFTQHVAAVKLVERRFKLPNEPTISIWEETGESIARHLWDAGITLSCQLTDLKDPNTDMARALLPTPPTSTFRILELGTGCGMVGITLAQILPYAKVLLTDLPLAQDIAQRNIDQASQAQSLSLRFLALDWDVDLPSQLPPASLSVDLVIAADCTYNADSSPSLVRTLVRLAESSPNVIVAIAMKMRHSSEQVFFGLMQRAGFVETAYLKFPLPGDVQVGEEMVHLHVYRKLVPDT